MSFNLKQKLYSILLSPLPSRFEWQKQTEDNKETQKSSTNKERRRRLHICITPSKTPKIPPTRFMTTQMAYPVALWAEGRISGVYACNVPL
jgi:hypothetical protein